MFWECSGFAMASGYGRLHQYRQPHQPGCAQAFRVTEDPLNYTNMSTGSKAILSRDPFPESIKL